MMLSHKHHYKLEAAGLKGYTFKCRKILCGARSTIGKFAFWFGRGSIQDALNYSPAMHVSSHPFNEFKNPMVEPWEAQRRR